MRTAASRSRPSTPSPSMQAIKNPGLAEIAKDVQARLKKVVASL
jgi:hypothetical protein